MVDPFVSFHFDKQMCSGRVACPIWDHCLLSVFVPFGMEPQPVERQIRIASQLAFPRESIRARTEAAILEALAAKHNLVDMDDAGTVPLPAVWIPPRHHLESALDDAFVLVFERLANNKFQGVALVNDWDLQNVDVASLG